MHNIRLIALDMDGTLLNTRKELTEGNLRALAEAAASGAEIVPATGRFFDAIPEAVRCQPFVRYAITINGAAVFDVKSGRNIYSAEIPKEMALEVFRLLDGYPCIYDCYQDNGAWMTRRLYEQADRYVPDPHMLKMVKGFRTPVEELKDYIAGNPGDVQKIMAFADMDVRAELWKELEHRFPELVISSSVPNNLEINIRDANKGNALRGLAAELGLSVSETAAFGDGLNDLTMLEAAGTAVAMGNSVPEILQLGDYITDDCDHDGVAKALRHFGLAGKEIL